MQGHYLSQLLALHSFVVLQVKYFDPTIAFRTAKMAKAGVKVAMQVAIPDW